MTSSGFLLGREYSRKDKININESTVIARYLGYGNKVIVNVGAHYGSSLCEFMSQGWKAYAFEPDEKNRGVLINKYGDNPNVVIDPRALSNNVVNKMAFFTSHESTGISSLNPFHSTHKESSRVSVTTLKHICEENQISHINFLLIDTEGFDLFVLKGLDWGKIMPDVIVCEFEDNKTKMLGYDFYDLANFIINKGYILLISEWYPVVRYGIRHDWRRLAQYPCQLADNNAWGNILAFKETPDWQRLMSIIDREIASSSVLSGVHLKNITSKIRNKIIRMLSR